MSVSMDEQGDETANARDLASWLDDYTAGRCDRARMQASFLEICRSNPEAPWDALALLDQYQRRGRVDATLARSLKSDIAQLVFGVVNQSEEDSDARASGASSDPETPTADTTGTRWRRMVPDGNTPAARSRNEFVDPIQFSRDIDPLTRPPPPPKSRAPQPKAGTAPGSILRDRYELLTILGRGRNGTVYKALDRHRGHLDVAARCVALRVLTLNYRDSPEALGELERQFHQAQSLAHPNIVSVFDLDRDGATYFLVMELLEGELLSQMLERLDHAPMARENALSIIGSMGAALAHAHRRGVVHSDLKPGNVMITTGGEIKVLDFGFVRREHADPRRLEPWVGDPASSGSQSGLLAYASEERVNAEPVDPGEDVYSLGCMAYELLSGEHPYGGRSAPLARALGRAPQRISGLTNRQWMALQTAVQWSRAERKIDVVELIAGLGCASVEQRLIPPEQIGAEGNPRGLSAFTKIAAVCVLVIAGAVLYWRSPLPKPEFLATILPTQQSAPQERPQSIPEPAPVAASAPEIGVPDQKATAAPEIAVPNQGVPNQKVMPPEISVPDQKAATPAKTPAVASVPTQQPKQQAAVPTAASVPATVPREARSGSTRIAFDKDTYVATESDGTVKLTIKRSGSTREAAHFRWALLANSASAGDDFAAIGPGTETIAAGSASVTLTIPLVSDAIKEPTELFLVELSPADDRTEFGEQTRAAVIIVDDD
ncbi:MAG TPA: protein kinase [Povalibacter sp.]